MRKVKMTLQEEILAIKKMNAKLLNENYEESFDMEEDLSNIEMDEFEEEMPMDEMGEYGEEMPTDDMTDEMSMYEDDALG
jgi:hypothetical protein